MEIDQPENQSDQTVADSSDQQPFLLEKGNALKILDQTIDDGGAVKYTVLWENGATTEESVEALGQWDDLVQEYEHSQFSMSETTTKPLSPSPPTSVRKSQSSSVADSDPSTKKKLATPAVSTRPTRIRARANYNEQADSDDDGAYGTPTSSTKKGGKTSKKSTSTATGSSGEDVHSPDLDAESTPTLSARGYPRRTGTVKPQPKAASSGEDSSEEAAPVKARAERKGGFAPKSKKVLLPSSTETSFVLAHHSFCTRCGQKGEITKRKASKKKSDDEDDDEPLGALLLCECCAYAFHRACLRKTYMDSLGNHGFRCESCIKNGGAECLECHEWEGKSSAQTVTKLAVPNGVPSTPTSGTITPAEDTPVTAGKSTENAEGSTISEVDKDKDQPMDAAKDPTNADESAAPEPSTAAEEKTPEPEVLFRCFRCTYSAHDRCLKPHSSIDPDTSQTNLVKTYRKDWKCHQCLEWDQDLDVILAYRDEPIVRPGSEESAMEVDEPEAVKSSIFKRKAQSEAVIKDKDGALPQPKNTIRELLVKWKNMSYRKVTWVPYYWACQVVSPAKIKTFWKKTVGPANVSDVVPPDWTQVDVIMDVIFDSEWDGGADDMDAMDHIQSVFVKWKSLEYEHSTWDEPDEPDSPHYGSFKAAYKKWAASLKIHLPTRAKAGKSGIQPRSAAKPFEELKLQPTYISGGTLKDYQLDGLNWMRYNHWKNVNSILADEMGLGKTIQMVSLVTNLYHELKAFPCLIVVPNSTLTNWVREFEKWAPDLRVVAYFGPAASRSVIRDFELFHRGTQDLRCHVVVTTYEMITNITENVIFRRNSWECLVVDEGQRLKNENSILFVKLNELMVEHRVLLTGTPLQNNIRELFSLMSFLDPVKFSDVTELEKKYENLDKTAVEELHVLLKPFFLRRTKDEVLKDLPPKSEVIVPVGMSKLQKEIYRGILSRNHKLLQSITNRGGTASNRKTSLQNILMELRKCLNHPYLIDGIEPRNLPSMELVHKSLIEAGGKLELLHSMLPKLKANGHRVLIFSTMTRLLDILEDYLNGERYNYVRLDGSTSSSERQARIDRYNAPDSDVFVFLLSTRAGGVGVNLATADTIIIYDVDFNPKADMQALSRAHRIGQKNKVLVLKFMTRNSAEERIVQIGKKKMILDHLIVERMEDENLDPVDVESILKFGAKALFEEDQSANEDVKYDDAALDALLDRSKIEHTRDDTDNGETKVSGFGFAKVWTETKGLVDEDIPMDAPQEEEEEGFWSTLLRDRLKTAYMPEEEHLGRGARRKTVLSYAENGDQSKRRKVGKDAPTKDDEDDDEGEDYVDQDMAGSDVESAESEAEIDPNEIAAELGTIKKVPKRSRGKLAEGDPALGIEGEEGAGKIKRPRAGVNPSSPLQRIEGAPKKAAAMAGRRQPLPCLVCQRSHRDRCPESQDIPLVLERRQQIATSNYPENYKELALQALDRFLMEKQIQPSELPKTRKSSAKLSAMAARLGGSAYQENLRSMSIGKAYVPTITPGACIVCNQAPYHLPFKCPETRNVQFMQERCRNITLDPTISDAKKQEYVSTIKQLMSREAPRTGPVPAAVPTARRQVPYNMANQAGQSHAQASTGRGLAVASVIAGAAAAAGGAKSNTMIGRQSSGGGGGPVQHSRSGAPQGSHAFSSHPQFARNELQQYSHRQHDYSSGTGGGYQPRNGSSTHYPISSGNGGSSAGGSGATRKQQDGRVGVFAPVPPFANSLGRGAQEYQSRYSQVGAEAGAQAPPRQGSGHSNGYAQSGEPSGSQAEYADNDIYSPRGSNSSHRPSSQQQQQQQQTYHQERGSQQPQQQHSYRQAHQQPTHHQHTQPYPSQQQSLQQEQFTSKERRPPPPPEAVIDLVMSSPALEPQSTPQHLDGSTGALPHSPSSASPTSSSEHTLKDLGSLRDVGSKSSLGASNMPDGIDIASSTITESAKMTRLTTPERQSAEAMTTELRIQEPHQAFVSQS